MTQLELSAQVSTTFTVKHGIKELLNEEQTGFKELTTQYDKPDLNKSQKSRLKTPTASKVIPLGSRFTIV